MPASTTCARGGGCARCSRSETASTGPIADRCRVSVVRPCRSSGSSCRGPAPRPDSPRSSVGDGNFERALRHGGSVPFRRLARPRAVPGRPEAIWPSGPRSEQAPAALRSQRRQRNPRREQTDCSEAIGRGAPGRDLPRESGIARAGLPVRTMKATPSTASLRTPARGRTGSGAPSTRR